MRILVPTDFSNFSKVAAEYAAGMATKINAEVILFHVIYLSESPRSSFELNYDSIIKGMIENVKQESILLINELKKKSKNLNISYEIKEGLPIHVVIESFAIQNKIELIIMGTKGATGLTKVLIGSNTAAVISHSDTPVITVPEHAIFKEINHIVYASDLLKIESEIENLIPLAKLFGSKIYMLHVAPINSKYER